MAGPSQQVQDLINQAYQDATATSDADNTAQKAQDDRTALQQNIQQQISQADNSVNQALQAKADAHQKAATSFKAAVVAMAQEAGYQLPSDI